MHDEQDMRRMGALRRWMPITAGTFIVGWLAIAGIIPFAGFWSKDEILAAAWSSDNYALWLVGAVAALFTAFYMTRQVYLVFYGNPRWEDADGVDPVAAVDGTADTTVPASGVTVPDRHDEAGSHARTPHESPWLMTLPLAALALLSTIGGFINLPFVNQDLDFLARWLEPVFEGVPEPHVTSFTLGFLLSTIAVVIGVVGIVIGRAMYRNGLPAPASDPAEQRLGPFAKVLANAYYFDVGLARFVSGPITAFARFVSGDVDRKGIDGAVNGIGIAFRYAGGGLRKLQTGLVRNYALGIVFGTVLLVGYMFVRSVA